MEPGNIDERSARPSEMEYQSNFNGENENTRHHGENERVAIVNNELAHTEEGAGLEHMADSGAGVSDNSIISGDKLIRFLPVSGGFGNSEIASDTQRHYFDAEQDSNSNWSNLQDLGTDPDDDTTADADSVHRQTDDSKEKEKFDVESLNYELQVGYRILNNMMSAGNRCVNKLFLHPVDDAYPETAEYYKKIKEPMWMHKMKEKFENQEYKELTDFMADFRLMIENCYRFNGPDNFVSKKAQKLELMMKQKIALLSRDLRDKINGAGSANSEDDLLTSAGLRRRVRNPNISADDPSQQLLTQLRRDREIQERVDRRQKVEDRKAMEQARVQELQDWEDNILGPEIKEYIRTMWELPQLGLFVYLCMESLGLEEEVTQYQLERGLAMPRECSDFRRLMTCLLSTPNQRKSLKDFMPYHVWNAKLSAKLDFMYKILADKFGNEIQACYTLGLDMRAFKIMGKRNPLLKKPFHKLSFLKRVWILKNYCDFCLETQPYLQKTIDDIEAVRPMDVREVLLGSDGRGYRYVNFPMFTGKDIRIYKHPKHPEPSLESLDMEDWSVDAGKASASSSRCSTPVNPRTGRMTETPSASLRARALLQAAESKEASPMRDTSRSGSEAPDAASVPSSEPSTSQTVENSSVSKTRQSSGKKRKRSSPFFSKRKRLKQGNRKTGHRAGNEKSEDMEEDEKDDEVGEEDIGAQTGVDQRIAKSGNQEISDNGDSVCDSEMASSSTCDKVKSSKLSGNYSSNGSKESPAPSESDSSLAAELSNNAIDVSRGSTAAASTTSSPKRDISGASNTASTSKCPDVPSQSTSQFGRPDKGDTEVLSGGNEKMEPADSVCEKESKTVIKKEGNKTADNSYSNSVEQSNERIKTEGNSLKNVSHMSNGKQFTPVKGMCKDENVLADTGQDVLQGLVKEIKKENLSSSDIDMKPVGKVECVRKEMNEMKNPGVSKSISEWGESKPKTENGKEEIVSNAVINNHGDGQDIKAENCDFKEEVKVHDKLTEDSETPFDDTSQSGSEQKGDSAGREEDGKGDTEEDGTKMDEDQEEESDEDELPDLGKIEMVAESMEDIKQLMNKLSNPEPIKRGKRVYPGVMKPCEEELLANVTRFHDELLKYERSLINARVGMQTKLRKEVESYVEPKIEEAKGWDSEQSQSSKDSSDDEESEEKIDTDGPRQSKRNKAKATAALLSSAASKLSTINGEGNEDSNDSFELDISSRGRLRKRRVIPNNTEDTGLRKRKNLLNQDFVSNSTSTTTHTATTITTSVTQVTLPTILQRQPGKPWPSHIVSMLTSGTSNSAIKAQLAANNTRSPGQIVRLVAPNSDGTIRTLRVAGKPNVIISPQNLSNLRFLSSTGIVTLPRNRVVSSTAQSSHPVIQQLLLNQARPSAHSSTTVSTTSVKTSTSTGLLQKQLTGDTSQASTPSAVKVSLVITSPTSQTTLSTTSTSKSSMVIGPSSAPRAVVVTQVSTSVSQGGKQVLDLGSLSVTQLQQLMKNQAIQINTGAGNPTTLLLTTGLQHLATTRASTTVTTGVTGSATQIRIPISQAALQTKTGVTGASSLLAMINKAQRPQGAAPQILLNNKLNPLLTISRQVSPQLIRPQPVSGQTQLASAQLKVSPTGIASVAGVLNQGLGNVQLHAAQNRSHAVVSSIMSSTPPVMSVQPISSKVPSSASIGAQSLQQKPFPAPRIISSLAPTSSIRVAVGPTNDIATVKSTSSSVSSNASNSWTGMSDTLKSRIITVPLVHLSPSKKYASNVTVKALLENRGTKKSDEDTDIGTNGQQQTAQNMTSGEETDTGVVTSGTVTNETQSSDGECGSNSLTVTNTAGASMKTWQTAKNVDSTNLTGAIVASVSATSVTLPKSTLAIFNSHTLPLSVDTAVQPLAAVTTSEIILPTMNIKVPSPNTLPSVLHNKNGTTIVQSTKVPIPVASEAKTGDSLSPSTTKAPVSIAPGVAAQAIGPATRIQTSSGGIVVMPANSVATTSIPRPVNAGANAGGNTSQPLTGLKNITLKVTPQSGGSGQFVQGYMTSRGLVIPQTALLQQQPGNNIVLANVSQSGTVAQVPANQLQVQTASIVGAGNQQTLLNLTGNELRSSALGPAVQQQPQVQKLVVAAAPVSIAPSNPAVAGVLNQGANPNLKMMLVNPSAMSTSQPSSSATPLVTNKSLHTSTPASELVKQIVNNSQVQSGTQQQVTVKTSAISPGSNPQNAVQLLNNIGVQQSGSAPVSSLPGQTVISAPTGVNPQLAAQILALQQNSQLQQQQPNLVLTAKSSPNQVMVQSQNKPSVVTLQLNQLGQLFSNLGGATQLQVGGATQIPQQQQQVASLQQQFGTRLAQPNQVLQLTVNQPSGGQTILSAPQAPQVVRVGSQLSPQLQLTHQGMAQIQPHGSIVIQQQPALLPQQQTQNIIIQQPNLAQQAVGQNAIHIQSSQQQQQLSTIQQLPKPLAQSVPKSQTLTGGKLQVCTSTQPQVISSSQTPGIVLSQLQSPAVSVTPNSANQAPVQFMISPSNASQPPLSIGSVSTVSPSVNKIPVGSLPGTASVNRIIRADPALMQTNMNNQNTGILTLPPSLSPRSDANRAMIIGSSAINSSTLNMNKPTQMIIPNTGVAGQFLISPVKLAQQNSQANLISPIKFVGPVQTPNTGAILGQNSTQLVVNNQMSNSALAGLQGQVPVKPAVIYAGQPSAVYDKKEGKIAQILLSQPISNSSSSQSHIVINSNSQATSHKPAAPQVSGTPLVASKLGNDEQTLLYKIGDQYFAPATSSSSPAVQQIISPSPISSGAATGPAAGAASAGTKADVKLLVPPAYIEASDQILKQNTKLPVQAAPTVIPSLGVASSPSGSGLAALSQSLNQIMQKGTAQRKSPIMKDLANNGSGQPQGSINGVHQGSTQFSFSLSGPATLNHKQPVRPVGTTDGTAGLVAQIPTSAVNQQNNGGAGMALNASKAIHDKDSSTRNSAEKLIPRRNTFSGGQDIPAGQKGTQPQRHMSVDETSLTTEDEDEKEAALNLLTLANQQL